MDGDLLGDMAFAAPANESASQTQPTAPIPTMDFLSGSPIKTKEQVPSGSPINDLENGKDKDAGDGVSQLPFSDDKTELQTQTQSEPQEQQQSSVNGLLDFPASFAVPVPSDPKMGVKPFPANPGLATDPCTPPTQQTKGDPPLDPFPDQPSASHPDRFAASTTNDAIGNVFDPFSDQSPQSAAPDLSVASFATEAAAQAADSSVDPFSPVEQTDEIPVGAQALDLFGDSTAASEQSSTSTYAVGKSGDGNQLVETQCIERTTTTAQTAQEDQNETSKLENITVVPAISLSPLETPTDKALTETAEAMDEAPSTSTPPTVQKQPETAPSEEVAKIKKVGPTCPEEKANSVPDPPAVATTETSKLERESSGDSKEALIGESQSKPTEPSMPQNGNDDKSENSKQEDSAAIPGKGQNKSKASDEKPHANINAATNGAQEKMGQQGQKADEPAKAIPPIKIGMVNQKLDFGMASNMFRSFSSKSGAQLKQLQSKGGVSLKVGLSRLGEASSNLAGTIKQKNAVSNVFKVEESTLPENMQPVGSQHPSNREFERKDAASMESASETPSTDAPEHNVAVSTSSGERKDEGKTMENEEDGDVKPPKVPHPKNTSTTSESTNDLAEKTTDVTPVTTTAGMQTKGSGNSESKEKGVKQGLTASAVTSLFGLKIEKLPIATSNTDKAKIDGQEKKTSLPKNAEKSNEDDVENAPTAQLENQTDKEQNTFETEKKNENGDPKDDSEKATQDLEENATEGLQKKQDLVQDDVDAKATLANESFEEKKQESFENPLLADGVGQNAEVNSVQNTALSDQNAKFIARIAALEKELRTSKDGSLKQIQTLEEDLQARKEDSARQIQTLQKELQASKDGSSRLIKSLEKKLHASQETVKQLKDKSMKLQQGAEENELKKDLIEDLNSKLQTEMSKRQDSETTAKKTKEKLDKVAEQFNALQTTSKERLLQMKGAIDKLMQSNKKMEEEIIGIREERDEQGRRLSSNTTQLHEAKKNAAIKVNAAEHYELKMNELDAELKQTKDKMAQIKFERDRFRKELGNWKKYAEDRNKQLEGQLKHEKKLNEERKRRMKFFVEAKTEEARSSNVDNVSLQAELDQTTRSLKDFNQRYKQLHSQWVQAQTRNRELQRDMAKMKNDSEKMSKVGGTLEAKLSRYSNEIEDHKSKRLAAKNELMTVIAKLEEEKKASARVKDFVKGTIIPKVLLQHQVLQESADHFEGGIRQLALRFGREFSSLRRKSNGKPDPLSDWKPKTLEEIQAMIGDANTARILSKLEDETQRVNEQVSNVSTSAGQLESLLVAPTTKGCVGAMFSNF
ncbi:unnamed protein product [Cylindrotheca closterium]|uniref:Uncharacterized protein n=1 Tax=Cylindrotheca closterium TaxID=2856 RepID=A0AAD2PYA3_9STRA|nr:unnamed protein product [Cylindrotheca closterium]